MPRKVGKKFFTILIKTYHRDNIAERSAMLAFYLMISVIPIAGIMYIVSTFFADSSFVAEGLYQYTTSLFGENVLNTLTTLFNVSETGSISFSLASFIGFIALIYGATNFFFRLQKSLFDIFNVELEEEKELKKTLMMRILAIVNMILLFAFVILLVVVYFGAVVLFQTTNNVLGTNPDFIPRILGAFLSLGLSFCLFCVVYRFISFQRISWYQAAMGGIIAAALLVVVNTIFSIFLAFSSSNVAVSAVSAFIAFAFWIYYVMKIMLVGAVMAKSYRIAMKQ